MWKILRWPFLAAVLIWIGLAANAWKYFSESGGKGVYFSFVHALDVVRLPDAPVVEELPKGFRALSHAELHKLASGPALQYKHATRRHLQSIDSFVSANEYASSSSLSVAIQVWEGRFVIDGDRICNLPLGVFGGACYQIHTNADGDLYRYVPEHQKFPAEWQPVERYQKVEI